MEPRGVSALLKFYLISNVSLKSLKNIEEHSHQFFVVLVVSTER